MAIDTRDRRASAIGVLKPYSFVLPNPDVLAEDQSNRQQLAFVYCGILASAFMPAFATTFTFASARIEPAMRASPMVFTSIRALLAGSEIVITPRLTASPSTSPSMNFKTQDTYSRAGRIGPDVTVSDVTQAPICRDRERSKPMPCQCVAYAVQDSGYLSEYYFHCSCIRDHDNGIRADVAVVHDVGKRRNSSMGGAVGEYPRFD